jgi:hypothetical protein
MSAARKAALADPAVRAKMSATHGWLTPEQRQQVIDEIRAGDRRYVDIAEDWLITEGRVAAIAREAGAQRRPRAGAAPPAQPVDDSSSVDEGLVEA